MNQNKYTKLYEPTHMDDQFIDYAKAAVDETVETVVAWFRSWRKLMDQRRDVEQQSQDSMGSDSWQGEEETTTSSLFLHGVTGVGKSSIVYACARQFNFTVIEVHAGMERNGSMIRETLKEATQSDRIQAKNPIANFFKPKSTIPPPSLDEQPDVKSEEKKDSLLLFSGVDLLFGSKDEGFWGALKKISETTKIPIIFTADTVDANTGIQPESKMEFEDFDFKAKCTEVHIHRTNALDAITYIRMIALHQGYPINELAASKLVHYSLSYRQCLLNLQLWCNAFPRSNGSGKRNPVEALLSSESELEHCNDSKLTNPATIEPLYQASIPFVAQNRWRLLPKSAEIKHHPSVLIEEPSTTSMGPSQRKIEPDAELSSLSAYLSNLSTFDRHSTVEQEVRVNARSDCYHGRGDTENTSPVHSNFERAKEIRCWAEVLTLQHTARQLKSSFGHIETIEDHLFFDTYHTKSTGIATHSASDRIVQSALDTDGIISHTGPEWYSIGQNKWAQDYGPAVRGLVRHLTRTKQPQKQGSRRSQKGENPNMSMYWYEKYGIDIDDEDVIALKSAFEEAG